MIDRHKQKSPARDGPTPIGEVVLPRASA